MTNLAPHQQRVVDERTELNEKREKLARFFNTDLFRGLDQAEKDRLRTQYGLMGLYSDVLHQRIAAFGSAQPVPICHECDRPFFDGTGTACETCHDPMHINCYHAAKGECRACRKINQEVMPALICSECERPFIEGTGTACETCHDPLHITCFHVSRGICRVCRKAGKEIL